MRVTENHLDNVQGAVPLKIVRYIFYEEVRANIFQFWVGGGDVSY